MCRAGIAVPKPELHERAERELPVQRIGAAIVLLAASSCTTLSTARDAHSAYEVLTDADPVLVNLDGFARGYTHSALDVLVRKGVERAGRGQVVSLAPGQLPPERRMVLHIEEGFQPPVAQITLTLFAAGRPVRSVSTRAPAPGAFPNSVFIQTVSGLTWRLLPPVNQKVSGPTTIHTAG